MEPNHIKRLKDEHSKGIQLCQEKIAQWLKFKADYEVLKERLETLPDSLSYDVTVPFGINAFTMGKIVHTNEVMVLLGDNWFAEVSAKQAAAIADRRIKQCTKMLADLDKEKEQYHNWMNYIDEVSANNEGLIEIVEKYDDEEEKRWREQHAKNVKAYRQKLARERKNSTGESTASNSDDEYRQRLESLELTEEDSEVKSEDGSTFDYSDDTSQLSEEHSTKSSLKLKIPSRQRTLSFDSGTDDGSPRPTGIWEENGKHVRWQDLSRQNIKRITFKHSKRKKSQPIKCQSPDPPPDEPQPLIQSPSDIYKQFGSFFPASPPKSILKVKHSPTPPDNDEPPEFPSNTAFTGEVYEHAISSPIHVSEKKSSRPTSHFKSSRKNRKK
ncbi:unconventional prefoldin RPB5 interactor-like [Argiope bruennichi]|uniref:Unconventional prefoldin RPB5 interactor like protein n=1 Tax=Argiope bruennichi TaxID=94029 RepID=A0A8T0FUX3_ARGBR|nr:unconventional prefoldin RPB5 interactor-like [Argiope bruennichi]KAF8794075.1 Unconventional prefoldin RPB5 interactor like protein [Argiope bruennichi]